MLLSHVSTLTILRCLIAKDLKPCVVSLEAAYLAAFSESVTFASGPSDYLIPASLG